MLCAALRTILLHQRALFQSVEMHQDNQAHQDDIPPRSTMEFPSTGQRIYDTTRVVRTSQIAFIRDRLDQGLSPPTVAGLAAVIDQSLKFRHPCFLSPSLRGSLGFSDR